MYDRNISIYNLPSTEIWKQEMSNLPYPFPELAERMYITNSDEEFDNITKYHVLDMEKERFLSCKILHFIMLLQNYREQHMLK